MIELDDFLKISRDLERFHGIFYTLWEMGKPRFTDTVSTAAVEFDTDGRQIDFLFNPDYWNRIDPYEREFVICHECLHVVLNHGIRMGNQNPSDYRLTNIAMDLVVNTLLVRKFGFDRNKISMDLVWADKVLPDKEVPEDRAFEFYFNLLKENRIEVECSACDSHDGLSGEGRDEMMSRASGSLSGSEKQQLQNTLGGTGSGNLTLFADTKNPVAKKKKWETVIKKWSKKYTKQNDLVIEQWARLNRRLFILNSDLLLPSDMEVEDDAKDERKIEVFFFQDTSGSCRNLKDRFFKAARSLPEDRFDVRMFCFDTRVYSTSLKTGKLYGFGGTSFAAIERYIQRNTIMQEKPYPDAIFVVTDGMSSDCVKPEKPERWHFFLSTKHTRYVPPKSNIHMLSEFE